MVDLHHHLLPGLDDGSPDLETSIAMARTAVADGITHVVCTPHANSRYVFEPDIVARRLAELRTALHEASIPLHIIAGCDLHLSFENIQDALAKPTKYTIGGKGYLLVELPDFGISPRLNEIFYDLRLAGMIPILTHPERNATLQRDNSPLAGWLRAGLLLQVTAGSILGEMGKPAQRMAEQLLSRHWVHFLATDAHHVTHRPPKMSAARDLVTQRHGADYARLLCSGNPLAAFEGRPLPEQNSPQYLFEEVGSTRPSFWKRFFPG